MICDTCGAEGVILWDHDGENECAKCRDRREEREAEAAAERQTVWAEAVTPFAENH